MNIWRINYEKQVFEFFEKVLYEIFPKDVQIIDGSQGVANRLKYILEERNILGNNGLNIEYYYSGKRVEEQDELNKLLNQ